MSVPLYLGIEVGHLPNLYLALYLATVPAPGQKLLHMNDAKLGILAPYLSTHHYFSTHP